MSGDTDMEKTDRQISAYANTRIIGDLKSKSFYKIPWHVCQ